MKRCRKLHLAMAEAVACGCYPPPRTEFDHLMYGTRPIQGPSASVLCTILQGDRIAAHRYLPRAPVGTPPEIARAFHAWAEDVVPWVDGPPPFVVEAMRGAPDAAGGTGTEGQGT